MISFVARNWRKHGNTQPIPFCQNSFTNANNSKRLNQATYQGFNSKQPIIEQNIFTKMFPQYNVNYDLTKNDNMAATLQQPQPQQQQPFKNTKKEKHILEEIVVPCSFGEWIILRLIKSMNKPLFLTPHQVAQLISLKSDYTNLEEQALQKFYNILIEKNSMNFQSTPMFKSMDCLKQALYQAYNENRGNSTQLCKFSISARGITRIEPLDNLNTNNKLPTVNNNDDNTQHNSLQGGGDTNNEKILWKGKNGFIKLESYQSNNTLSVECENLPKLYNVSTLDTQHIKNIKEMYELYERGLHKLKVKYDKKKDKLPKWALKKYGYGGNNPNIAFDPKSNQYGGGMNSNIFFNPKSNKYGGKNTNMFFDPKSNQYFSRTKQKQLKLKHKFNKLTYTFNKPHGYVGRRLSEIPGTNLIRRIQNNKKSDDGKINGNGNDNGNSNKNNFNNIGNRKFQKNFKLNQFNSQNEKNDTNDNKKEQRPGKLNFNNIGNRKLQRNFKLNQFNSPNTRDDIYENKKDQRFRKLNLNNIGNRNLARDFELNQPDELEKEKENTYEWKLLANKESKMFDDVGAISKMMQMKTRHAKYATLQPTILAKLYKNAMANKDSVNPEELEALQVYVEQIMPTALSVAKMEPKWQPPKQSAPTPRRSSAFSRTLQNSTSFDHHIKHKFFKSKKSKK